MSAFPFSLLLLFVVVAAIVAAESASVLCHFVSSRRVSRPSANLGGGMRRCDSGQKGRPGVRGCVVAASQRGLKLVGKMRWAANGVRNAREGQDGVCDRGMIASFYGRFEWAMRAFVIMRARGRFLVVVTKADASTMVICGSSRFETEVSDGWDRVRWGSWMSVGWCSFDGCCDSG